MLFIPKFNEKLVLQFKLDSVGLIPASARLVKTKVRLSKFLPYKVGYEIKPTSKCSLVDFPEQLMAKGLMLYDATWQQRFDKSGKAHYVVRYLFDKRNCSDIARLGKMWNDLQESMVHGAIWEVCVYKGSRTINLSSRIPISPFLPVPATHYVYFMNRCIDVEAVKAA